MSQSHEEIESWKLGIKLQFLISWSQEQGFTPNLTTREICESVIKPATQEKQLSYCEQLLQSKDKTQFVGRPNAFISHAWDYHFLDVLEALTSYFAAEDVLVWFDVFSNNQHKASSLEFDWWCETFKNAIQSFGRTVMVLAPWNDPLPLQRGWCIWELYCTIEGKRLVLYVVLYEVKRREILVKTTAMSSISKETSFIFLIASSLDALKFVGVSA